MFSIDNTKPVMIQPARTVGSELPIRAVILRLIISDLKDLSGIPNVTQEDHERKKYLSKKQPPAPQSHHADVPTPQCQETRPGIISHPVHEND